MQIKTSYKKLLISIALDFIGLIPIPFFDYLWAPISGLLITKMYKGTAGKIAGIIGFLEEIFIFTDFIPTFTIMWIYEHVTVKKNEENLPKT